MPPEEDPIGTWSGASRGEILLLFGAVVLVVALTLAIRTARRWLLRRREMRKFFSIVDGRNLNEREETVVRNLAADAQLPRPTEVLTSLATFDSLAEAALRQSMKRENRELLRDRMESLYGARTKLFPDALDWEKPSPAVPDEAEAGPSAPARPDVPTQS